MDKEISLEVKLQSESTWTKLVMYKADTLPLSKKLIELQDISQQKVAQSKTIYLPSEETTNDTYFGAFRFTNNNTFNAYAKLEGRVMVDGVVMLRGFVYFKGYNHSKREYEIFISEKAGNIKQTLGEKTMDELVDSNVGGDFPIIYNKYAHNLTIEAVTETWDGSAIHSNIHYPINDWGNGYGLGTDISKVNPEEAAGSGNALWDLNDVDTPFPLEDFRPAVKVIDTVKSLLEINGFTLDTSLIGSTLNSLFCLLSIPKDSRELIQGYFNLASPIYNLPTYASFRMGMALEGSSENLKVSEEVDNGTPSSITYEGDNDGKLDISISIDYRPNNDNAIDKSFGFVVTRTRDGSTVDVFSSSHQVTEEDIDEDLNISAGADLDCNIGDVFKIYATSTYVSLNPFSVFSDIQVSTTATAKDETIVDDRNIKYYLKNTKQYDFVKGVLTHLGLFLDYDPVADTFILKTYEGLDTGVTRDWSDRVDYINEFKVQSLTDYLAPQYLYETGDNESYLNELVQKEYETVKGDGYNYGSLKLDLGVQVAADESTYKSPFAVSMVTTPGDLATNMAGMTISRSFKDVEDPKDSTMKLELYFTRGRNIHTWYIRDKDLSTSTQVWSPSISAVRDGLFCGFRFTQGFESVTFSSDLFNSVHKQRWEEWIGLEYSPVNGPGIDPDKIKAARIIQSSMWLTAEDYAAFRFGDKITLDTGYGTDTYRVLEITGLDPFERKACSVKLIKIV